MQITKNNFTIRAYPTPTGKYQQWTVAWLENGKRQRKKCKDQGTAEAFAENKFKELRRGQTLSISPEAKAELDQARNLLGGESVLVVACDVAEARKIAPGVSCVELARFWSAHHAGVTEKKVIDVVTEMVTAKRHEGLSKVYLCNLEQRCERFAESFQRPISTVTGFQILEWLNKLTVQNRTKNNLRGTLITLFEFARVRRYLSPDWREMDMVPPFKEHAQDIEVFTPEEMGKLLAKAEEHQLPFLAIGGFAGIRHSEIQRLVWTDVRAGHIVVNSKKGTAGRRIAPIQDNLAAWLAPYRGSGPVCTYKNMSEEMLWLARQAGVVWKHNALRHSYISYRLAIVQDVAKVALECGNSPRMIFSHYRELVTREQAEEWFNLKPK